MSQLVIRTSIWANILWAISSAVIGCVGLWKLEEENSFWNWLMIIAGFATALGTLFAAFDRSPKIIMDDDGLNLVNMSYGILPWSDITYAYADTDSNRNRDYLHIELADPEKLKKSIPHLHGNEIIFPASGYDMTADEIADAIMRKRGGLGFAKVRLDVE